MKTWKRIRAWWKIERLYLYVYRCRRPSGWGRHNGYTGITNSPWHRDRQHKQGKDWADLIRRRYVIPIGRMPRGFGLILESLLIVATAPVYNVKGNRWNPRRITPARARAQRMERDRKGWTLRAAWEIKNAVLLVVPIALAVMGVVITK